MSSIPSFRQEYIGSKDRQAEENPRLFPPPTPNGPHVRPTIGIGMFNHKGPRTYPLYRSAEALEYAVNEYFELKESQGKPPTMAGLALSLGFKSTKTLKEYEEMGEEFSDIVETARTMMEEWKNEVLLNGTCSAAGVIFDLKNNHSWKERVENNTTVDTTDTLMGLMNTLQGQVLRPELPPQDAYASPEPITEAEFVEMRTIQPTLTDDDVI